MNELIPPPTDTGQWKAEVFLSLTQLNSTHNLIAEFTPFVLR